MEAVPKVVAVVGASRRRRKYGNKAVRAFLDRGYTVVPINPRETEIEGLPAYRSVCDVPGRVDLATFYVVPDVGLRVMDEVAEKGIQEVWLNPGADSPALIERARALGISALIGCSIRRIGESPHRY
jgi:uncharacterized protein